MAMILLVVSFWGANPLCGHTFDLTGGANPLCGHTFFTFDTFFTFYTFFTFHKFFAFHMGFLHYQHDCRI